MKEQEPSRVKKNWAKVKNIIMSKSLAHKQKAKKFQLFKKESKAAQGSFITTYQCGTFHFVQATPQPIYKQLLHFSSQIDATGKWVWQAEEIAAYYLIHSAKKYLPQKTQKFRILELGAGCSGLASITLAKIYNQFNSENPCQLLITDGQSQNIPFLSQNIELNDLREARGTLLRWGEQETLKNISCQPENRLFYDIILVCDCLYFTQFHKQLLLTIDSYLAEKGTVLLINPKRGDSMQQFLSLTDESQFEYAIVDFQEEKYRSEITRIKNSETFNEEKDIPYFIELSRKKIEKE